MILKQTHINGKQPVGVKKTGLNTNKKYEPGNVYSRNGFGIPEGCNLSPFLI